MGSPIQAPEEPFIETPGDTQRSLPKPLPFGDSKVAGSEPPARSQPPTSKGQDDASPLGACREFGAWSVRPSSLLLVGFEKCFRFIGVEGLILFGAVKSLVSLDSLDTYSQATVYRVETSDGFRWVHL